MNGENTKWFSQTCMTFKDTQFATDGYMRVGISTSTDNYKTFNPPIFNISISNQISKSYNLNIQNAEDLLESFTTAMKQLNGHDTIVEKKYNKKTKIYFKFAISSNTEERVVVIEMFSNETDMVRIIIPAKPTFQTFIRRLKYYVEHYDDICIQLLTKSIDGETKEIINQLPSLIKGISGQIISQTECEDNILDSRAPVEETEVNETASHINDLDKFIGGNEMENIKIPEIEEGGKAVEKEEVLVEINSNLIDKVLGGDLSNLESKLTSYTTSKIPVIELAKELEKSLGFDVFHDILEDDKKSLIYMTTTLYHFYTKNYNINGGDLPSTIPPFKFKSNPTDKHVELAKDLLMIMSYVRAFVRRIEVKNDDAFDNKTMFYIFIRLFMDSFCYSFLTKLSRTELIASVKNRYEYFNKNGFFDSYHRMLKDNNCIEINVSDVMTLVEEVSDNIITTRYIDELHDTMYQKNSLKLPSKNKFNLEQIINEIVPTEVTMLLGQDLKDKDIETKFREKNKVSDEIFNFLVGNKKVKKTEVSKKITPLMRIIKQFQQDIPEKYRNEVIEHSEKLEYNTFDFSKSPWPLEEFDERIVKAFYVWDPNSDEKMKSNYDYFVSLVENDVMTKDSILVSSKLESSEGWNAIKDFA
jgi:hypothetical protein